MNTERGKNFWGPSIWRTIHSFAAMYSPSRADEFIHFLYDVIPSLLPCTLCRENFKTKLTILPPHRYLGSNHDLFFWTYMIHDIANRDITEKYNHDVENGTSPDNSPKSSPDFIQVKYLYFDALKGCSTCKVDI